MACYDIVPAKEGCAARVDVINELPDGVNSQIMECLPLRDAARLGVLSKKWCYAWMSLPQLVFDAKFFEDVLKGKQFDACEFYNIVSLVLLSHIGPISKFYLYIPKMNSSRRLDTWTWISFLSRNHVKDLTVQNDHRLPLVLSSHLFSCLELEKLKLDHCKFSLTPSFKGFRNLLSLELHNITFVENTFRDFVASCPMLENLILDKWTGFDHIDIYAPNLKYLTISGKFESICFLSAQNLMATSITLEEKVENSRKTLALDLIEFFTSSSKIEKLFFRGYFCKFLTAGGTVGMLPTTFEQVKELQLLNIEPNDLNEFNFIVGMIGSCPNLEELDLSFSSTNSAENKLDCTPFCSLSHLRNVRVTSVTGINMELLLIEFLLLSSPMLETLCVERNARINTDLERRMSRELIRFRRASPMVEVVYLDPKS